MLGRKSLWAAGAVVAGLMLPSQAMAQQYDAHTRTDLNLRVGPGTEYGVIDVIPGGYPVDVLGCLDAYEWCDIEWDGLRGWVSARYLVQPGTEVYLPQVAPRIGVPIISFSFGTYHDRYYRDRPWHRERHGRWTGGDWRDRDRDRDRRRGDRDGDRDRDQARDRDRDRDRDRAERPRQQRDAERPRQQRDAERPRQQRDAERPRQQREARPQQQQREARPQQQEREARPRQGERTQRQGQRQLPSSGGSEALQLERGQ